MSTVIGLGPAIAFTLGCLTAGLAAAVPFWCQRRRLGALARARARAEAAAEAGREILAVVPEGLFLWDVRNGTSACSHRLAALLELPAGIESTYDDLRACFRADAQTRLDDAVITLRREGTGFEMVLPLQGATRRIVIRGIRAATTTGQGLADVLWLDEVAETAATATAGHGTAPSALESVLAMLPWAAWLRDADGTVRFANRQDAQAAATLSRTLAESALACGRARTAHLHSNTGAPPLQITETPLPDGGSTLGFAHPESPPTPATPAVVPPANDTNQATAEWRRMLEILPVALAVFDRDTRLAVHNTAYAALWGFDGAWLDDAPRFGEILDCLRERRVLPEVADYRAYRAEQLVQFDGLDGPSDTMLHLPDGRSVRCLAAPRPGGGLVLVYEDVSGRLALERSINEFTAAQRETLDNLHEGIAVFGGDGRLKLSNPALARIWVLDDDLTGQHVSEFVERTRPFLAVQNNWEEEKKRQVTRLMRREPMSGRIERSDGSVLEMAQVPLPDGALLLSFLDVTDGVRVEQALRQRAEALQEANRLKSAFIANISYEVRTPLTTLIGFAEILANQHFGTLNKRQMEYAAGILDSARGLMTVVNDILELASIEAGLMALDLDAVDLHSMLAGVLGLVRERARHKGLSIAFDCPPDIGWIVADEKRLRQILYHLLSNAVRFTPRGGTARLEARRDETHATLTVADNGPGIDGAEIARLMQPFERSGADDEGAGLGLALVNRFVKLHGGTLEVRSTKGRGTTVICRLPVGESVETVDGTEPKNAAEEPPQGATSTVLSMESPKSTR